MLFSGSVRTNLDPYNRHSDAELWDALGHVALKEVVAALPEGLSARVAENGGCEGELACLEGCRRLGGGAGLPRGVVDAVPEKCIQGLQLNGLVGGRSGQV